MKKKKKKKKIEDKLWDFPPMSGQGQNNSFATPVQNYYKRNREHSQAH